MSFERVTYTGPAFDDAELLDQLPPELAALLLRTNGLVAFGGGLHIRGACREPPWHSLRAAWLGSECFALRYPAIQPTDIPFAEDALGDQFLLRDAVVHRLAAETGDVESLGVGLTEFLENAQRAPVECLGLEPLVAFEQSGGRLEPGQLLSVYPPYVAAHEGERSMRAIPAIDRLGFLASLAKQIRDLPDGAQLQIKVIE